MRTTIQCESKQNHQSNRSRTTGIQYTLLQTMIQHVSITVLIISILSTKAYSPDSPDYMLRHCHRMAADCGDILPKKECGRMRLLQHS